MKFIIMRHFSMEGFKDAKEAIEYLVRRHPMRKEQALEVLKQYNGIDINEK